MIRRAGSRGATLHASPRSSATRRESARAALPPERAWRILLAGLGLGAFAWRIACLHRVAATPLFGNLVEDSRAYWLWSAALLRFGPAGGQPYFLGPLYPHVLALVRLVTGGGVHAALVVQAVWGSIAAVLLADAARRLTSRYIGFAVGVVAAGYGMAVFFDGLVLTESLLFALQSALIWWVVAGSGRPLRLRTAFALGVVVGLMAECRATALLALVPLAIWCRYVTQARTAHHAVSAPRSFVNALATMLGGTALIVTPFAVHNWSVAHEWIPFTYNSGYNLYVGNNPRASGTWNAIAGTSRNSAEGDAAVLGAAQMDGREYLAMATGGERTAAQSSQYWATEARRWILAHPARAVALATLKVRMLWNHREYAQIENVREYETVAGALGWPFVGTFGFVGPLALAALLLHVLAREPEDERRRARRFVAGLAVTTTIGIVPFFVTDRYRHQLLPAVLVLGGWAAHRTMESVLGRKRSHVARAVAAIALGGVAVAAPAPQLTKPRLEMGIAADLGRRWAARGEWTQSVQYYERSLDIERRAQLPPLPGPGGAIERSDLWYGYGRSLLHIGRTADGIAALERAVREAPDRAPAIRLLADAYQTTGRRPEAESLYASLAGKVGGAALTLDAQAWQATRQGRFRAAESLFVLVTEHDRAAMPAWGALIRLQAQRGDVAAAHATLDRARAAGLTAIEASAYSALVAALEGRRDDARRELGAVPDTVGDPALADVIRITRDLLSRPR